MTLVLRSTYTETVLRVRMPLSLEARNDPDPGIVADASRFRSIGSLQALALAVAAAVVTPAMLWLAL
ncbi:hypothetical protein [Methylobacterium oxalidis]|uniref:hypothetical protein n=1 Tax=Methylobacterium oxalidis TaxID=944322 RepID=UPI003314B2A1